MKKPDNQSHLRKIRSLRKSIRNITSIGMSLGMLMKKIIVGRMKMMKAQRKSQRRKTRRRKRRNQKSIRNLGRSLETMIPIMKKMLKR